MCIDNMFQVIFNKKKKIHSFLARQKYFSWMPEKSWKDILERKEMLWIEMLKNVWKGLMNSTLSM